MGGGGLADLLRLPRRKCCGIEDTRAGSRSISISIASSRPKESIMATPSSSRRAPISNASRSEKDAPEGLLLLVTCRGASSRASKNWQDELKDVFMLSLMVWAG